MFIKNKFQKGEAKEIKSLLENAVKTLEKHQIDAFTDKIKVFADNNLFNIYVESIAEGLEQWPEIKEEFKEFANKIRYEVLNEYSTFNMAPQAMLVLPIFRMYWPKLVAREAVSVLPMSRNMEVMEFLNPQAHRWDGTTYNLPTLESISSGGQIGDYASPHMVNSMTTTDLLATLGLTADQASIERNVLIVKWEGLDLAGNPVSGDITYNSDDDGRFSFVVEVDTATGLTDTVTGIVNYANGTITVSSERGSQPTGKVTRIGIVAQVSPESNLINTRIDLSHTKKVWLTAVEKKLTMNFSTEFEFDSKAYLDLDIQSTFINMASDQIATEIDREIITEMLHWVDVAHVAAKKTFQYNPPATSNFALTRKAWLESIIVPLNEVSAQIYNDTFFGTANVILANPSDITIFESLDVYTLAGNMIDGGAIARSPKVAGTLNNRWVVLSSPVVPLGKMLLVHKPDIIEKAIYIFGVYQPLVLSPFPLGNVASMTLYTRYAKTVIRPEGLGLVEIDRS